MLVIDGKHFLSTSEVALRFGVSPRTILRWHENNPEEMGAVTGINGRTYFNESKIDQTIHKIYFKSSAPPDGTQRRLASRRPRTVTA